MREILFRAKRIDNGEWVEGHYFKNENGTFIFTFPYHANYADIDIMVKVDPKTVGQYTGLTDKNGNKIFEGDIVTGVSYSVQRTGGIVWIDDIAGFGIRYIKREGPTAWENCSILKQLQYSKTDQFTAAVIGNIFDNPELLGKESEE